MDNPRIVRSKVVEIHEYKKLVGKASLADEMAKVLEKMKDDSNNGIRRVCCIYCDLACGMSEDCPVNDVLGKYRKLKEGK